MQNLTTSDADENKKGPTFRNSEKWGLPRRPPQAVADARIDSIIISFHDILTRDYRVTIE